MTIKAEALRAIQDNPGKFKTAFEIAEYIGTQSPAWMKLRELEKKRKIVFIEGAWWPVDT